MEAYIDLSYIFHLLLCIISTRFVKIFSSIQFNKKQLIILEISSVIIYANTLFFVSISSYLNVIYFLVLFYIFFKKKFLRPLFYFIFSYYSQIAIIRIFTNNIYLYKGILMIYKPVGIFYILVCPLLLLLIEIITKSIKSLVLLKRYRYNVRLTIKDKSYSTTAYFDSGNTLKIKNLPVVFLIDELKDKNENYEKVEVEGIGKENSDYHRGKILFNNNEKEVYFAYVNKRSFNGCKCLLNVYLLG